MKTPVRLCDLVRELRDELALEWLAGQRHARRPLFCDTQRDTPADPPPPTDPQDPPGRLLVIPQHELKAPLAPLAELQADPRYQAPDTAAFLLTGDRRPHPEALTAAAPPLALLYSPRTPDFARAEVRHLLSHRLADHCTQHGVFMEVQGVGVLLQGGPGVGKSELALEMLTRGHRLVADDTPLFARIQPHILSGTSPSLLRGFLEVRGLGILNVRRLFGHSALKRKKSLQLIIELRRMEDADLLNFDRLHSSRMEMKLLGLSIPKAILPVTPGRELAILVETAVRQHINRCWGYDAAVDFTHRQMRMIADDGAE